MASPTIFQGQLVGLKVNGLALVCNTDVTVNMTRNLTENPVCKPLSTDTYTEGGFSTNSIGSTTGTVTGSALAVADLVADPATQLKDSDIMDLFLTNPRVEAEVATTLVANYPYATVRVYTFPGILSDISWNNPSDASSTTDFTIS